MGVRRAISCLVGKASWRAAFVAAGLILLFTSMSRAQFLDQGAITGIVRDQTGSVIRGARVTLTNVETNRELHATTDSNGLFVFSPIAIGHYSITVSAKGFKTTQQENLDLQMQQRLNIPIKLYTGVVTQTVKITSAPPLLETQQSSVNTIIDTKQINHTPLNGRNWVFMAQLAPGVVGSTTSRAKGTGDFNANGLRTEQNAFVLDGMNNMAISVDFLGGSSFLVNPPPDALQEFSVMTSDYSAEFGHSAGAVVDASIKSGTNNIHGDLWEYWRNNVLDARDFDALTIPEFRENQFGATLGMPFIKNKLFFFGDTQEIRIAAGQPFTQSVPTQLERQGNFSQLLDPSLTGQSKPILLYEPGHPNQPMVCNGQQNVLCPNQIDPIAQRILSLYPLPNANSGRTYANNVQNLSQPQNTFQYDTRIDWDISPSDSAFAVFSDFNQMGNYAGSLGPILDGSGGEGSNNVSGLQLDFGNNFVISETHIFSPTLVNELRFGYDYGHFDTYQLNYTKDIAATLGMGGMPFAGLKDNGGLPQIGIGGIAQAGTHAYRPEAEKENEYQIIDDVNKTFGKQSIKFGVEFDNTRDFTLEPPTSHGAYNYGGFLTSNYGKAFTGYGVADFMTDEMNSGQVGPSSPFNNQQWHSSAYAQDDWRVTPALTLNLGLRYDWFEPYKEMANRQANFYANGPLGISTGSGVLEYPIQQQGKLPFSAGFLNNLAADHITLKYTSDRQLTHEQVMNFSPRVGFAYSLDNLTVLHGGFGIFYQGQQFAGAADNLGANYPFVFSDNFPRPTCVAPDTNCATDGFNLETGFQSAINQGLSTFLATPNMIGQSPHLKTTYAEDYNLTLQRSITRSMVATLGYVGDVSRHVPYGYNPNQQTFLSRPGVNSQPLDPFPAFGGITFLDYEGMSSYNSLQAKLQQTFSHGLQFLATYTWGHALDDSPDPLGGGIPTRNLNIIPARDEYTNSSWDTRQRFILTGFYRIPYGRGTPHVASNRILNSTLGGWAVDAAYQAETGQPFTVYASDITLASGGGHYALLRRNPFKGGGTPDPTNPSITCPAKVRTLQHWFNPCAFANPLSANLMSPVVPNGNNLVPQPGYQYPAYVTGIAAAKKFLGEGRGNQIYGPGFNRLDMSLFKNFHTFREQRLQFRIDGFNVLNHPEWANPSDGSINQSGGLITSARAGQVYTPNARCFQISGKYIF